MRLLLLVLLLPSLPPALCGASSDPSPTDCVSSLQLQDTVRSSLRSEENAQALHRLVADHRADAAGTLLMLQQLRSFMETSAAEQRTALEKAVAEQKSTAATAAAEQKSAAATAAAEQKAAAATAAAEQKAALVMAVVEQQNTAGKIAAEQKTATTMATLETRVYLGILCAWLLAASAFLFYSPLRAVAMLRAYIGPQHAPP
jgi:hypothetical protein